MNIDLVSWILTGVVGLWLGSMELRMRRQEDKMTRRPDRYEVIKEIDVRLEPIKVQQAELKEDIKYIRAQVDKVIDRLSDK